MIFHLLNLHYLIKMKKKYIVMLKVLKKKKRQQYFDYSIKIIIINIFKLFNIPVNAYKVYEQYVLLCFEIALNK